jgi:hypothetical protein
LNWSSLVNIDNLPSLVSTTMTLVDDNGLAFSVLVSTDIEASLVLNVAESFISICEDLEPSRVGAPDLHVLSSSSTLNVPGLVVQSGSDGP